MSWNILVTVALDLAAKCFLCRFIKVVACQQCAECRELRRVVLKLAKIRF